MSLASLINKKRPQGVTVSQTPSQKSANVSRISNISISKRKAREIETTGIPAECAGCLMADGPYLPWGPYLTPDRLEAMQQAVIDVVTELSRIEQWSDEHYDIIVVGIKQQPISTLAPDLEYFQRRLREAQGE